MPKSERYRDQHERLAQALAFRVDIDHIGLNKFNGLVFAPKIEHGDRMKGVSAPALIPIGRGSFVFVIEPVISSADVFIERP